jgi:hypothetical protein
MTHPRQEASFVMTPSDSEPAPPAPVHRGDEQEIERRLVRAERMECLAALTSGLTHALSNLLASTLMSIDLVLRTTPEGTAKQLLVSLQGMNRDGLEMVRQLLGIARGVAGEPAVFQPQYLLVELQKLLTAYMPAVPIITNYPQDLWPLSGDPQTFMHLVLALCLETGRGVPAGTSLHVSAANAGPVNSTATDGVPAAMSEMPIVAGAAGTATSRRIVIEVQVQSAEPLADRAAVAAGGRAARCPPAAASLPAALWIVERPPHPIVALAAAAGGTYEAPATEGRRVARVYLPAAGVAEHTGERSAAEPLQGAGDQVLIFENEVLLAHALSEVLAARGYRAAVARSQAQAPAGTPPTVLANPGSKADLVLATASLDAGGRWRLPRGAARTTVPVVLMVDAEAADLLDRQPADHRRGFEPRAVLRKPFTTNELLFALAGGRRP